MRVWLLIFGFSVLLSGCTQLFFFPQSELIQTPDDMGYRYEDVLLTSSDEVSLHGWFIQPSLKEGESSQGVVYFLHGNAQNISWHVHSVVWLLEAGFEVFAIDYRGYGRSGGVADLPAVYDDIEVGHRWLRRTPTFKSAEALGKPRIVFAQSLGASLALNWMANQPEAEGRMTHVIAESGFSSFGVVAREAASTHWLTWLFQYPAKWFLDDEQAPRASIARLSLPVLIVHSQDDEVVDFAHSERLVQAGGSQVQHLATRGPHIAAFQNSDVREIALDWLKNSAQN